MKRILFSTLGAAALLVTSCSKDGLDTTMAPAGEVANVSLSVAMGEASATRTISTKGTASEINRMILEVYTTDDLCYYREVQAVTSATDIVTFDLKLVTSETYDFVAWADCSSDGLADKYYDTDSEGGLQTITADYTSYKGNDEERDAFFGIQTVAVTSTAVSESMTLTRPFGQLNISTNLTDVIDEMCPDEISIAYTTTVADTFDARTGAVSGDETITWNDAAEVIDLASSSKDAVNVHLSTDYILVAADDEKLFDFEISLIDDRDDTTTKEFTNIPIKRNYRTNISGELLTVNGSVDVDLNPVFENNDDTNGSTDSDGVGVFYDVLYVSSAEVDSNAYYNATINTLILPEGSVTSLGYQAFLYAKIGNDVLTIPSSVASMSNLTFSGDYSDPEAYNSFTKVEFSQPGNLATLPTGAFQANWQLEEVILPSSLTSIKGCAFYGCGTGSVATKTDVKTLTITMPSTTMVTTNMDQSKTDSRSSCNPFLDTKDVTITIKVPANLVNSYNTDEQWGWVMGNENCGTITFVGSNELVVADNAATDSAYAGQVIETLMITSETVGVYAFNGATVEELTIAPSVTTLGRQAFTYLKTDEVVIPATVTSIGQCLFDYAECTSLVFECASVSGSSGVCQRMPYLETVVFENNFANVPAYMFAACPSLESVTFKGTNVPSFDVTSFQNCHKNINVYVPAGKKDAYLTAISQNGGSYSSDIVTIVDTTSGTTTTITVIEQ